MLDLSQTWNNGAVTFTGLKFNVVSDTSAAASLLMDLQVGGVSQFQITKAGRINGPTGANVNINGAVEIFTSQVRIASTLQFFTDTILTRRGAANLRLGAADAAVPVAQTLSVQSITGTNASAAAYPFKITGAQGTGNAAGGSIIFQVAPAGGSGAAQNTLVDALTIDSVGSVRVTRALTVATLPGTPLAGMIARVTDANTPVIGTTVADGGAAYALVNYNGANWTVIGV